MSQRWEYCKVSNGAGNTLLTYCGRDEWLNPRAVAFFEAMEQLGNAGWELVSVLQTGAPLDSLELYFKRPIEPGRAIDEA